MKNVSFQRFYHYIVTIGSTQKNMNNSKFVLLLKTLSPGELKQFRDFVHSPFFNKEKVLKNLADYLKICHPEYDKKHMEKEKVFEFLYPGKKYNDALMRNIISNMLRLANEFLAVLNFN